MLPIPRSRLRSRRATTAIEYALIASLVSVFILGSVAAVGTVMRTNYYDLIMAMFPS